MKNSFLTFILLVVGHISIAQIGFEKGYFIDKGGTRTECTIENSDWKNNPSEFLYKIDGSTPAAKQVTNVVEFGIYNRSTYKTTTVDIDRSFFVIGESYNKNPDFKKETLALKLLVSGTASLYYYEDRDIIRFFFQVGQRAVEQLVFKEYMSGQQRISKNETFKQQLWLNVKCGSTTQSMVNDLRYDEKSLTNYFTKFNQCSGDKPSLEKTVKRKTFFAHLSSGVGVSSLAVEFSDQFQGFTREFKSHLSYHVGVELEFILPFNRNKWALLVEPSFNTFNGQDDESVYEAKFNTLELGLGARHFFHLNENSKILVNAMVITYLPLDKTIGVFNLERAINYGVAVGAGYAYKRLSVEVRHNFNYEVLGNYLSWSAQQERSIVVLRYRVF
jgi:hypothetical protein